MGRWRIEMKWEMMGREGDLSRVGEVIREKLDSGERQLIYE